MNYCLIEKLEHEFNLPENYVYVALTQSAIYELEQRNLTYITFEDYYTSGEIRGDTDLYLDEQLIWFDKLDHLLKEYYKDINKLNLNLASIYFYWIKYMVDNIIMTCKVVDRFIKSVKPGKILFVGEKYTKEKIPHTLDFKNLESTYSRLIEPICDQMFIPF